MKKRNAVLVAIAAFLAGYLLVAIPAVMFFQESLKNMPAPQCPEGAQCSRGSQYVETVINVVTAPLGLLMMRQEVHNGNVELHVKNVTATRVDILPKDGSGDLIRVDTQTVPIEKGK